MRKFLFYLYVALMFACILGGGNLPQSYQLPVMKFGLLMFGMFLVIGMPAVWRSKQPLRGEGLNVEFTKYPIFYGLLLLSCFIIGIAITAISIYSAVTNLLGIVPIPWLA